MPLMTHQQDSHIYKKAYFKQKTKKVNFMIRTDLMKEMEELIPNGKRSEFVNGAIEGSLLDYSRHKAYELMIQTREKLPLKEGAPSVVELLRQDRYESGHSSDRLFINKKSFVTQVN